MARRRHVGRALVLCALVGTAGSGCGTDCAPDTNPARRNVILVTVDTLRADHLGAYGSTTASTPELDRLAREGAVFERSYAAANTTVPSHLSLLTSLPLASHGVTTNGGTLVAPVVGLPALFSEAGYRTAAIVSAKHLGPTFALGDALTALDLYDAPRRLSVPSVAAATTDRALGWIRGVCQAPFFLWVHYWDPHMPYTPPPPFDTAYYDGDAEDARASSASGMSDATLAWPFYEKPRLRKVLADHGQEVRQLEQRLDVDWQRLRTLIYQPYGLDAYVQQPADIEDARRQLESLARVARARVPFRPKLASWLTGIRDIRYPRARYAGEVSYVDREIGRLHAELTRIGLGTRTVLAVTGDHGESLGDHGIYFDHAGLYEETMQVPLIIWGPGVIAPGRHRTPARGLDVAPTLLAAAGLAVPTVMEGKDLLSAPNDARRAAVARPVIGESAGRRQIMIVDGRWKMIRTLRSFYYVPAFTREADAIELYDLDTDPSEERDLATTRPEIVRALSRRLDAWLDAHRATATAHPAPESKGQEPGFGRLRALGYVE